MTTNETQPALRGHHAFLKGTSPADKARNAVALKDASGILADVDERLHEQEDADARGREEAELWARRWLANEASMDCE